MYVWLYAGKGMRARLNVMRCCLAWRDGFYQMQQQFSDDMKALRDAIDNRFVRMEEKIDKISLR